MSSSLYMSGGETHARIGTDEAEEVDQDHPGAEGVQVPPVPLEEEGGGEEVEEGESQEDACLNIVKEQVRAGGAKRVQR